MPKWALYFGIAGLIAVIALISGAFEPKTPALATLGSIVLHESDFHSYVEQNYPEERVSAISQDPAEREKALGEFFDTYALVAKARTRGIDREPRFRKALELMETKLLSHMFAVRRSSQKAEPAYVTEEALRAYYEVHKLEYPVEPRFTAYHLLVYVKGNPAFPDRGLDDTQARLKATQALSALRSGKSWESVARSYSDEVTTNPSGLIRDAQFGHFPPEVERAVKTLAIEKPSALIRSEFGYHVIQVKERVTGSESQPFDQVKTFLAERLQREHSARHNDGFMAPLREAVSFALYDAGKRDTSLLDRQAIAPDELLAKIANRAIREADFRWFLDDAFAARQRTTALARPGARASLLATYLDMLVLEANARRIGLDKTPEFIRDRRGRETDLLVEFLEAGDNVGPFSKTAMTHERRKSELESYVARARIDVGLRLAKPERAR